MQDTVQDPISKAEQTWLTGMDPISLFEHQMRHLLDVRVGSEPNFEVFEDDGVRFWDRRRTRVPSSDK